MADKQESGTEHWCTRAFRGLEAANGQGPGSDHKRHLLRQAQVLPELCQREKSPMFRSVRLKNQEYDTNGWAGCFSERQPR